MVAGSAASKRFKLANSSIWNEMTLFRDSNILSSFNRNFSERMVVYTMTKRRLNTANRVSLQPKLDSYQDFLFIYSSWSFLKGSFSAYINSSNVCSETLFLSSVFSSGSNTGAGARCNLDFVSPSPY